MCTSLISKVELAALNTMQQIYSSLSGVAMLLCVQHAKGSLKHSCSWHLAEEGQGTNSAGEGYGHCLGQ